MPLALKKISNKAVKIILLNLNTSINVFYIFYVKEWKSQGKALV